MPPKAAATKFQNDEQAYLLFSLALEWGYPEPDQLARRLGNRTWVEWIAFLNERKRRQEEEGAAAIENARRR